VVSYRSARLVVSNRLLPRRKKKSAASAINRQAVLICEGRWLTPAAFLRLTLAFETPRN
jgi:hypothetical protein